MLFPPFVLLLALVACCEASTTKRQGDRFVKLPVIHSTNREVFAGVWDKRAITTVPLANRSDVAYYAKLDIGTPAQEVYVQLDTGSFELWVNPDCSNLEGSSDVRFCQAVGNYDTASSSTVALMNSTKTLRYGIGSAQIQYVTDTIGLSGTDSVLEGVQFGVATDTVDEFSGILGIGHGENETITYKNFIDQLADQGLTDTKAFSLALGSKSEQEGLIIFGGMDLGKFSGTLQSLPIIPAAKSPDGVQRYWVDMKSMSLTPPSGDTTEYENSTMAVFLDSGATLTLLPTTLANTIAADFGSESIDANGFYTVDCSLNDLSGTLNFEFDGITIQVPYKELVRELQTSFGTTQCFLGISPSDDFTLLGDTMLRSAYAVFDQTNSMIHMAQYVNCDTNEIEITSQTDMSTLTGACDPPTLGAATSNTSNSTTTTTTTTSSGSTPTASVSAVDGPGASDTGSSNTSAATPRLPRPENAAGVLAIWVCVAINYAIFA
ncbi:acid protease [Xylariaceae sp. FL0016]|nr:acid protease [Xylariaceae sp. FL0016]